MNPYDSSHPNDSYAARTNPDPGPTYGDPYAHSYGSRYGGTYPPGSDPAYGPGMGPGFGYYGAPRHLGTPRNPWMVILLSFITLGIYGIYWWYISFQDVYEYRYARGSSGLIALLLAFFFPVVLPFLLGDVIENAQREDGRPTSISAVTGCWSLIPLLGWFIFVVRAQTELNTLWETTIF